MDSSPCAHNDGKLLFRRPGLESTGSPTVVQGVIYLNGYDNLTHALSAREERQIWQTAAGGYGPPAVHDGVVYVGVTAEVRARSARDGTLLWRSQTRYDTQHLFSTPVVIQGVVFVTVVCTSNFNIFSPCHNQVLALRASDGSVYWSQPLANPSDPVLDLEAALPAG